MPLQVTQARHHRGDLGVEGLACTRRSWASGSRYPPALSARLQFLLHSGIGPADELRRLGIAPTVDLPGVGANLIDNATVGIRLTTTSAPPDDPPLGQVVAWCTASDSAEPNGVLQLVEPDPRHQPDICLNLASDPEDERRLVEGVKLLLALAKTPAIAAEQTELVTLDDGRELPFPEAFAALETPEAAGAYVRRTVRHYVHPVGTARMGPDGDADAVVDQYGRVYGIQGLRVADASIMPNIRRANTNLTCIMIGGEAQQAQAWARPGPADCIVRTRLDAGRASPDASV